MTKTADRKLYNVYEVAEALGVSSWTVRDWCYRRRIAFVKLGDGPRAPLRIPAAEVERLIQRATIPANVAG